MSEWISVEDRLPDKWRDVLIMLKEDFGRSYQIGDCCDKEWSINNYHDWWGPHGAVTHWQPLPPLPEPPEDVT